MKEPGHCDCKRCTDRRGGSHVDVDAELMKLFKRAGLGHDAQALGMKFAFHEIDFDDLQRIFSPGGPSNKGIGSEAIMEVLTKIGLGTKDSTKVLAALSEPKVTKTPKEPTTVLALQGSASYLMIGLGIEKKLLTKEDLLEKVEAQLVKFANECANKDEGDKDVGDHVDSKRGITLAANCLYARAMLSSPTINAERIYCQRTFKDKNNPKFEVFSQVWAGFLAAKSKIEWPKGGAIAVDIGTGEMKFGYAEREIGANPPKMFSRIGLTNMVLDSSEFFKVLDATMRALNLRIDRNLRGAQIPNAHVKLTEQQILSHFASNVVTDHFVRLPDQNADEDIGMIRMKTGLEFICTKLTVDNESAKTVYAQLKGVTDFTEGLRRPGGEAKLPTGRVREQIVAKQAEVERICNPIIESEIKNGTDLTFKKRSDQSSWWDKGKIEVEMTSNQLMNELCQPMMDRLVIVVTELRILSMLNLIEKIKEKDKGSCIREAEAAVIEEASTAAHKVVQVKMTSAAPLPTEAYIKACEALEEKLLPIMNKALAALGDSVAIELLEGAIYSGREPVFVFGTQKMRAVLKGYDDLYGAQATELVKAVADFSTFVFPDLCPRLPILVGSVVEVAAGEAVKTMRVVGLTANSSHYRLQDIATSDSRTSPRSIEPFEVSVVSGAHCEHIIHFEMCDQEEEANCEHRSFLSALQHGQIGDASPGPKNTQVPQKDQDTILDAVESYVSEKDLNKRGTKKENVPCGFGNLAWGNGSTQGNVARRSKGKDGTVRVMSEMGLNEVKGLLAAALKKHGASYADEKKFAFNAADGPARCRLAFNTAAIKLRELIKDKNPSFELSPEPAVLKADSACPDAQRGIGGAPWEAEDGSAGGK